MPKTKKSEMSVSSTSLDQAELLFRLSEAGIDRTIRAVTDWREEGLLPPLTRTGLRGGGSSQFWENGDAVLEQAIAVDCLFENYNRADAVRFNLWQSGYPVDSALVQLDWIKHLSRQRQQTEKAAGRFRNGYLRLGTTLWRSLGKRRWLRPFIVPVVEAMINDDERDDDDYRSRMVEFSNTVEQSLSRAEMRAVLCDVTCVGWAKGGRQSKSESAIPPMLRATVESTIELMSDAVESLFDGVEQSEDETRAFVESFWEKGQLQTLLINREYLDHVRSMTIPELDLARASLAHVRKMVAHCVELTNDPINRRLSVQTQLAFMTVIGPFVANQLTNYGRRRPDWPLAQTISAIHAFVMMLEFKDLSRDDNNKYQPSERVLNQWTTTRRDLSSLWPAVKKGEG